jgi:uncharacterized protein (TIGR01777 family)
MDLHPLRGYLGAWTPRIGRIETCRHWRRESRRYEVKIVVTGGTGFIGRKLVGALALRGDHVTVLTRDAAAARAALPSSVDARAWSPSRDGDGSEAAAAVDEADAVVHLAGAGVLDERWTKERLELVRSSRVLPTRWLAGRLARAASRRPTWVSASAVGVYGMRKDDEVLDEQATHGDDVLASICEAWEAATKEAEDAGVRVAIPRIGIVLGTEGGALAKMLPPFKAFVGGPVGDGRQWVSWVHWRDVVAGIVFAIDHADLNGPFNMCAPKPVTMNDLARGIGAALHRPSAMRAPAFALRIALGPGAEAVLTGQRAVPARLERAGFAFAFQDIGAALKDLLV